MTISLVYSRKWGFADLAVTGGAQPANAPPVAGAGMSSEQVDETGDTSTAATVPCFVKIPSAAADYYYWIASGTPALSTTSYETMTAGAAPEWRCLDVGESIVFSDTEPS